ncbi:MAG: hypothetical protein K2X49_13790 [Acetobacteraceae bacterium]|nr:hypothetical protein [Acetobacteraceae bacterium]
MSMTFARIGAAAALAIAFSAGALAQQNLNPQGSGSIEMDHTRMGGQPAARSGQHSPGSPSLNPQGSGSVEMDHGRMGSGGVGSPAGGTITGNPGSGPEVEHGHEQGRQQQPRR